MNATRPLVSILITTYNRSRLLRRAINSVLMQNFDNYELVVIDDCSPDNTRDVVASINDPRIRYIRNETNVGSKQGDRAILRRFIYELMRGQYFVYLCDDDYWLYPDLLSRQVKAFHTYDNVAMVMGGQLSYFLTTPESYFGRPTDDPPTFALKNIDQYFDLASLTSKTPHLQFMQAGPKIPLFEKSYLTSTDFLSQFALDPATKNIIGGAMLYSRDIFVRSGTLRSPQGSQWQAGYELKLGPACYGNIVYFDEPSIVSEIRANNASFQRTQIDHYFDSIKSIELAFEWPLADPDLADRRAILQEIMSTTIHNLSRSFLGNALQIYGRGSLSLCSEDNMERPVTFRNVLPVFGQHHVVLRWADLTLLCKVELARYLQKGQRKHRNLQANMP